MHSPQPRILQSLTGQGLLDLYQLGGFNFVDLVAGNFVRLVVMIVTAHGESERNVEVEKHFFCFWRII